MKKIFTSIVLVFSAVASNAQTTAMDFNRPDCNGNTRHLFASLDSGKVAILEYYMGPSCSPCINTAHELSALKAQVLAAHPGMADYYAIGFQDSYSCAAIQAWVAANAPTAIPLDSGAAGVAYYGGFSMPTVVVVAGPTHKILFSANGSNGGYTMGDTSIIRTAINQFFNSVAVQNVSGSAAAVRVFPNPSSDQLNIEMNLKEATPLLIEITDLMGKVVLIREAENVSGAYSAVVNTQGLPCGNYILRVKTNNATAIEKVNIVR
jgi:hypothetical protein